MGADLYIEKIYEPAYQAAAPLFEAACKARDAAIEKLVSDGVIASKHAALDHPDIKALQEKVSECHDAMYAKGYFRDSYNRSSLFWVLGLSWWDLGKTHWPKGTMRGNAKISALRDLVLSKPLTREIVKAYLEEHSEEMADPADVDGWFEYWTKKRQDFVDFLNEAANGRHTITFSC